MDYLMWPGVIMQKQKAMRVSGHHSSYHLGEVFLHQYKALRREVSPCFLQRYHLCVFCLLLEGEFYLHH